jgi:hypothetical protein
MYAYSSTQKLNNRPSRFGGVGLAILDAVFAYYYCLASMHNILLYTYVLCILRVVCIVIILCILVDYERSYLKVVCIIFILRVD